ncbi:ATP-binding protein [Thalassovita sp.]|uniref:ATP-binding protein n=1 Tax=Thalassovita sp. TaxID=1979401 RepID=UPI002AB2808E|nr:ATP-binding protein [Thalassovita sp.]
MQEINVHGLFENTTQFPDVDAKQRLAALIGIEAKKTRLSKMLALLIDESSLIRWQEKFHPDAFMLNRMVTNRPPLVILEGDVGSGKTALAESIGDAVARMYDLEITLLPLSLSSRGQGRVGEMTQLLSAAFEYTCKQGELLKGNGGQASGGIILLIDEADALAQSREHSQMHHEDRAGVNAFIRGIDRIANARAPVAVIMCTNRLNALDPAVRRRAAEIIRFGRPDEAERREALARLLHGVGLTEAEIGQLVTVTGPGAGRENGLTYSDLTQRLVPSIIMDAFPSKAISGARAIKIAQSLPETPPFEG